jgi:hypothetical protein
VGGVGLNTGGNNIEHGGTRGFGGDLVVVVGVVVVIVVVATERFSIYDNKPLNISIEPHTVSSQHEHETLLIGWERATIISAPW